MSHSINKWLATRYRYKEYTCSDFTRDVWLDITGKDITEALAGLLEAHDGRGLRREHVRQFRELKQPEDPCLVVMQRPRWPVHIAVYVRNGVLQLTEKGVTFLSPSIAGQFHTSVRYIKCIA